MIPLSTPPYKSLMIRAQCRSYAHVLSIVDEIIFKMKSSQIAGKTFDGKGVEIETLHYLAGSEYVSPHIAVFFCQRIGHKSHHHGLKLLISLGNVPVGSYSSYPFVSFIAQNDFIPAFFRLFIASFLT